MLIQPLNDEILFEIQDDFRVSDAIVSAASTQVIDGDLTVTGTVYGSTVALIHSGGTSVGVAKTLNFVGTGNTFLRRGDTIDISISGGGGGGGLGTAINYADGTTSPFSYIDSYVNVTSDLNLDATVTWWFYIICCFGDSQRNCQLWCCSHCWCW